MPLLVTRRVLALVTIVLGASAFYACAEDVGIDESGATGGSSGDGGLEGGDGSSGKGGSSGDGGWPTGGFGSPCKQDSECASTDCTEIGQKAPKSVCTEPCKQGTQCPSGGYCTFIPGEGYTCVPDTGNQCQKCVTSGECPIKGDLCLASPNIDRFCARDCSFDGKCPSGFMCMAPASYAGEVVDPDAGPPAGDAGPTMLVRVCVPASNESCPCDAKRDGAQRRCEATSGTLKCEGTETCDGDTGKWGACSGTAPKPEVCDGADNDCNGIADDGTPDALCASQTVPPHVAGLECRSGICEIGGCETGWTRYPPGAPQSEGCSCAVEATEPNDTCAEAKPAGTVTDSATTPLNVTGRLGSDTDEDWYIVETTDTDEVTTNSYHIKIVFTAPVPTNDEFVFDVIRGGVCGIPQAKHSGLTSYDWCVDGTGTNAAGQPIGEQVCSATGPIHCGPHTKPYAIRVRRKPGSSGTCGDYTLTITGKGGGACDFSQPSGACDDQAQEM
jgi:hypothetical protein